MPRWRVASRKLTRRSLPLTMAVVVLAFVAATVYSQLLLTSDVDALDIAGNSAPGIAALADARGELRALGGLAVRSDGRGDWAAHRRRLERALADFARTPDYPGEAALAADVRERLTRLDALAADAPHAAEVAAAVDGLDGALFRLSELNRRHLVEAAQSITRGARRRSFYAFLLDGVAIVIAFFATLLSVRTVGRYFRAMDRRKRELEHLAIQVGHDIANPLAPIQVALHQASARADETERAGLERAQRSLGRIRETIDRLVAFAKAGLPPPMPRARSALRPALVEAARAAGCAADADADIEVPFDEPRLRALLGDFFGGSARPGGPPPVAIEVTRAPRHVRIAVVRGGDGELGDPFDPQLHFPGSDLPGIDLRLASVRRHVEAGGGGVGARRTRRGDELWIELPYA